MKTISKVAALAMTLALAGALSACGSNSAASSASASAASASASAASASATSASASAASAQASTASASTSAASDTASATGEAAEAPNVYQNEFFGISFNLPEGWAFVEPSAIENMNAQLSKIAKGSVDMVAQPADTSMAVVITVEEASASNASQTAETHLEAAVDQMISDLGGSSVTYVSNSATVDFEGIDRSIPATITKITSDGQEFWIGQACAAVDGNFFDISIVGASEEAVNQAFSYFNGASQQETRVE